MFFLCCFSCGLVSLHSLQCLISFGRNSPGPRLVGSPFFFVPFRLVSKWITLGMHSDESPVARSRLTYPGIPSRTPPPLLSYLPCPETLPHRPQPNLPSVLIQGCCYTLRIRTRQKNPDGSDGCVSATSQYRYVTLPEATWCSPAKVGTATGRTVGRSSPSA